MPLQNRIGARDAHMTMNEMHSIQQKIEEAIRLLEVRFRRRPMV